MKRGSVTKAEGQTHKDLASRHRVDYTSLGENNSPSFQGDGENNATKISLRSHSPGLGQRGEELHNRPEKRNHSREGGKGRKRSQAMISPPCAASLGKGFVPGRKRCRRREGYSNAGRGAAAAAPGGAGSHHCCADPAHNQHPVLLWKAGAFRSHILPLCLSRTLCKEDGILFLPNLSANHLEP